MKTAETTLKKVLREGLKVTDTPLFKDSYNEYEWSLFIKAMEAYAEKFKSPSSTGVSEAQARDVFYKHLSGKKSTLSRAAFDEIEQACLKAIIEVSLSSQSNKGEGCVK